MSITVAEILEALAHASAPTADVPPHTYGAAEIRQAMSWSKERFPIEMRPLIAAGVARVVKVRKVAIDGSLRVVPAYQFVPPPKAR